MFNDEPTITEQQWIVLEKYRLQGKPITGVIVKVTPEYMLVDVGGIKGKVARYVLSVTVGGAAIMIGASMEAQFSQVTQVMRGQEIELLVKEARPLEQHLVFEQYHRTFTEEQKREQRQQQLLAELRPGDVCTGVIKKIIGRKVSIDIDGVEATLHHTYEKALLVGQQIDVMITDKKENIFTCVMDQPQKREVTRYGMSIGVKRSGVVRTFADDGMYVDIGSMLAFIPTRHAVYGYITHTEDLYHRGQRVEIVVLSIEEPYRMEAAIVSE